MSAHVLSPFRADFTGRALELTNHWHVAGDANVENFDLRAWGVAGPLGLMKARLAVSWDGAGFSGRGKVDPAGLHAGAFDAEFDGSYAASVLTAKHMEARHPSGAHAAGAGTIAIVPNGPRLDLSGSWQDFRWPLLGPHPAVTSAAGTFTLVGILPYQVHVQAETASAAGVSASALEVTGALGRDGCAFEHAELGLLEGHASASGAVTWAPQQSWSVAARSPASTRRGCAPTFPAVSVSGSPRPARASTRTPT